MTATIIPFPTMNSNKTSVIDTMNLYKARIMALEGRVADLVDNPPLRQNERKALRSLIAFTAQDSGISTGEVLRMVLNQFDAFDLNDVRSKDYNDAVNYLVGFENNKMKI